MARRFFAEKRKFGGRYYDLYGRFDAKAEAAQLARSQRKRGRLARVISAAMIGGRRVYLVYTR